LFDRSTDGRLTGLVVSCF